MYTQYMSNLPPEENPNTPRPITTQEEENAFIDENAENFKLLNRCLYKMAAQQRTALEYIYTERGSASTEEIIEGFEKVGIKLEREAEDPRFADFGPIQPLVDQAFEKIEDETGIDKDTAKTMLGVIHNAP